MKKIGLLGVFIFTLLVVGTQVNAETVLRAGDNVSLAVDQTVSGDFYGISTGGAPISLSGTIEGDAIVMGSSVTANGTINGDLLSIGGTTQVHASVTDDVRIISGEVTIAQQVGGDVVVLGGVLTILSSATVEGNVFFYGGEGEINGSIGGSVYGTSEHMRIDGPVAGSVDVKVARSLVLGDRADIGGDVRYESKNELVRAQNAVVVGSVVKNSPSGGNVNPKTALVPFLIYAFSVLIVFVVFRRHLRSLLGQTKESFTRMGLIGLGGMIVLPVAIILSFVTVIGSVIGLLSLTLMLALYIASFLLTAIFMGVVLNKTFNKSEDITLIWTLIGIVAIEVLFLIPVAGPLVVFVLTVSVFGSLLYRIYRFLA